MISWLTFKGHDRETDFVARESIFQSARVLRAADRSAIVQLLPSSCYERLFELTTTMALQRVLFEGQHGDLIRHDLLIAGSDASDLARFVRSSIPGYRSHWQYLQSGDHDLRGDLDTRIGYARAILDKRVPFWKEL